MIALIFRFILLLCCSEVRMGQMVHETGFNRKNLFYFLIFLIQIDLSSAGLYNETVDEVFVLNHTNFDERVVGSANAWIVEFYHSWCGHCVRFAPVWKELAVECKGWQQFIKVAAIDCSENLNTKICTHYEIVAFPTMTYLPASSKSRPAKLLMNQLHSIDETRKQMIGYISNISLSNLNPHHILPLIPLRSFNEVWNQVTLSGQIVVSISESNTSYLGREIILDLYGHSEIIVIRRLITTRLNSPSSYLLSKEEQPVLLIRSSSRKNHLKVIKALIDKHELISKPEESKQTEKPASHFYKNVLITGDNLNVRWRSDSYMKLHESDLEAALSFSLRHEIPLHGQLNLHRIELLIIYLKTLINYLPIREDLVLGLKHLRNMLITRTSDNNFAGLNAADWLKTVSDAFNRLSFSDEQKWVSCKGSTAFPRGYPCGLWMTFHALTINAVLHKDAHDAECLRTLLSIRDYVQNFFGCQECVNNFMKGGIKIESLVKNCQQGAIFLWRSHNKANLRLKGDETEDPKHPKTQFPNKYQCPSCHLSLNTSLTEGISKVDDNWNEVEVMEFLTEMYYQPNVIYKQDINSDDGLVNQTKLQSKVEVEDEKETDELEDKGAGEGAIETDSETNVKVGNEIRVNYDLITRLNVSVSIKDVHKFMNHEKKTSRVLLKIKKNKDNLNSDAVHLNLNNLEGIKKLNRSTFSNYLGVINIFNHYDLGMCLAFYLFCGVLLVFLYLHFMRRLKLCRISVRMKHQV